MWRRTAFHEGPTFGAVRTCISEEKSPEDDPQVMETL